MYEAYFGFRKRPFDLVPDPDFLFLGESHDSALANLELGIESGKGFVVITGGVGTGKTTVLRAVLRRIGREMDVGFLNQPDLDASELLRTVLEEFGSDEGGTDKVALRRRLREVLADRQRAAILVIDEAHLLSEESLEQVRLLSNFEESDRKLLQIILAGQPELKALLSRPRLRPLAQRIEMFYEIRPLAAHETAAYVERRIQIAGNPDDLLFEPKALAEIHARTGGVPRLINLLAERSLITAYVAGTKVITTKIVREAFRDLGEVTQRVMVAGEPGDLAFGPVASGEDHDPSRGMSREASPAPAPAREPVPRGVAEMPAPWRRSGRWSPDALEDEPEPREKRRRGRWLAGLGLGGAVALALLAFGAYRALSSKPSAHALSPAPIPEVVPSTNAPAPEAAVIPAQGADLGDETEGTDLQSREVFPETTPIPAKATAASKVIDPSVAARDATAEPTAEPAAVKPVPSPPPVREDPANATPEDADGTQDSGRFAIQCGSFRDLDRAHELADRIAATTKQDLLVLRADMASGTWYRVLLGSFDSQAEAVARLDDVRLESETLVLQVVRHPESGRSTNDVAQE